MRILAIIGLVLGLCMPAFALPLGANATYEFEAGELLVPGSATDVVEIRHSLEVVRPFDIQSLVLKPYISGEMYSEDFCDKLILSVISVGTEVDLNDAFTIGAKVSRFDWNGDGEDLRKSAYLKVKF